MNSRREDIINKRGKTFKFSILTLGCKVNQYESDRLREDLCLLGFNEAEVNEGVDVCIINTCTVTREAARKSRQMIRRAAKSSPNSVIYAIGCAAEIADEALVGVPQGVNFVKNRDKVGLAEEIRRMFGILPGESPAPVGRNRIRAFLKVQDGCDNFCSYCIVPHVRGRSVSRHPEEILAELNQLEHKGFLEVVLTGVHLGDYGKRFHVGADTGVCPSADSIDGPEGPSYVGGSKDPNYEKRADLMKLLEYLLENSSLPRIRLSSLEPMDFSLDLLTVFEKHERLCRHLHLPLQHASDKILKLMGRNYTLKRYNKIVSEAINRLPGMSITTDILVGFPGETEKDFQVLYDYVKETPFLRLHVFPFSLHPRVKAAGLGGIVPNCIKRERVEKLIALGKEKTLSFLDRQKGETMEVLAEQIARPGVVSGHTENYISVEFPGDEDSRGKIYSVKINERLGENLYGEEFKLIRPG